MTEKEIKELSYKDTTELLDVDKATLLDIIECLHYDMRFLKEERKTLHEGLSLARKKNKTRKRNYKNKTHIARLQRDLYKNTLIELRNQIERIRQYFSKDLQADFVLLLEIIEKTNLSED